MSQRNVRRDRKKQMSSRIVEKLKRRIEEKK
jgi:hypothetical protein